jgi:predicted dehydrogenase
MSALKAGKHVLVEKPITSSSEQAKRLIQEAEKRGLVLMVDHTFLYTGAVQKLKEEVQKKTFGDLLYYDSTRVSFGLYQPDVNVLWDLAVHDLSIMSHIVGAVPREVSATGRASMPGQPEDAAYLTVYFDTSIAHVNVNWLSPVKARRTVVGGTGRMIVYDDVEPSEKIKVYDKSVSLGTKPDDVHKNLVSYRIGNMESPRISDTEALFSEATHFIDCIQRGTSPLSSGAQGLEVVSVLEAANRSLSDRGAPHLVNLE